MKTEWDYTELADAYLERPPYSKEALAELFAIAGITAASKVCDIGAGVGHLTIPLAQTGCSVAAVEPNDAMRKNGKIRTAEFPKVEWFEASGEATGLTGGSFAFVTFGSSFNVLDRMAALRETHRLLLPGGHFACLWNHRDLDDPVQKGIEDIIKTEIPNYDYGTRRQNQSEIIAESGLFEDVRMIEGRTIFTQPIGKVVEAWRSHGTLHRQARENFAGEGGIIDKIDSYLRALGKDNLDITYITRAWIARRKD